MEKPTQTFTITKKEDSQFICLLVILFLEQVKIIILNYFLKNVNMLLKKNRCQSILLTTEKFLQILTEKILMKKIKKIITYLTYFIQIFFINYLLTIIKKTKQRFKKKSFRKKHVKDIKIFLKKKKKKSIKIIVTIIRIFLRNKRTKAIASWLYEKLLFNT